MMDWGMKDNRGAFVMKAFLMIVGMMILTGCATPVYTSMDGTGTQQGFYQAKYTCMQQSQPHGSVGAAGSQNFVVGVMAVSGIIAASAAANNFRACMAAAGWIPEQHQ
jgi:hypothetical protein